MHVTVQITGPSSGEDVLYIEIEPNATLAALKERIAFQSAIPPSKQALQFNGQRLSDDTKTLEQSQITADSMLGVLVMNNEPRSQGQGGPSRANAPQRAQGQQGQVKPQDMSPEMLRQLYLSSPYDMANLRRQIPLLADAINDPGLWKQRWEDARKRQKELKEQQERDMALLESDPFDVDAQRRIEELIRLERVEENFEQTREYHPEAFGRVTMLYVPVEVNSHSVMAFVDSGAQTTIMSPECAQRCGIMRLLDTRFSGIARGVGTAKILGRVHNAPIKIGSSFLPCSFTVMEGKDVDLLLGLDMQKRHQAIIDLRKNVLQIAGNEVPFLSEGDIPKSEEERADEPTVQGPGGAKIGGVSGAIKEPGKAPGAAPISQSSQPEQASTSGEGSSPFPDVDIARLMDMGMGRAEAIQALTLAGGNVDAAAGLMFG